MVERVRALEDSYADLVTKCVERRTRLEDSRQLWQFYWDMAEEDNWIKEMVNILSQVRAISLGVSFSASYLVS